MNTIESKPEKPLEILLVEDNDGDIFLTKRAFEKCVLQNTIQVAKDGEQAIKMLKKENGYSEFVSPDLILLDINLPKKNGRQVLEEIKKDELLRRIPVVMLTSSRASEDVLQSYDLHANCYILKPSKIDQLDDIVEAIERFWFTTALLPYH